MSDEIRLRRSTLILAAALALAVVAIMTLVTALVLRDGSVPIAQLSSTPSATGVAGSPEPESSAATADPTNGANGQGLRGVLIYCGDQAVWLDSMMLSDGQTALTVDGFPYDSLENAESYDADDRLSPHRCVLDSLRAPESVLERMKRTRALDGTQNESWGDYKVTWTYHPDQGLDAVFSEVN